MLGKDLYPHHVHILRQIHFGHMCVEALKTDSLQSSQALCLVIFSAHLQMVCLPQCEDHCSRLWHDEKINAVGIGVVSGLIDTDS